MAVEASNHPSRRAIVAALGGGFLALVAQALNRPIPLRATHDGTSNLHVGGTNSTTTTTTLTTNGTDPAQFGFLAQAPTDGFGVKGTGFDGGVLGEGGEGDGVVGLGAAGVYGSGGYGVMGDVSAGGTGVYGFVGDVAAPLAPGGVAIYAAAATNALTALQVKGKARFNRSGKTSVAVGASYRNVSMAGVGASSLVFATVQTNRAGYWLQAVVPYSGGFRIHLNKAVTNSAISVVFFVLN